MANNVQPDLEAQFLEKVHSYHKSQINKRGNAPEEVFLSTPNRWSFCQEEKPNGCSCKALLCKAESKCTFQKFGMMLKCELYKAVEEIDVTNMTKDDCECKFSFL